MMSSNQVSCTLPAKTFTRIGASKAAKRLTFRAFPLCVDFYRLIKMETDRILPWVNKWDLLNITIALYNTRLPDIGVESIRENVCGSASKTILLLRDPQDVLEQYQEKFTSPTGSDHSDKSNVPSVCSLSDEDVREKEADMFSLVFSDSDCSEDEEESESDREESERFDSSLRSFLTDVRARRHQRTRTQPAQEMIGAESCLVAALTYNRLAQKSKEKIIELTLLSTRKRYRRCGVGSHMLKLLKDVSLVGFYDSIVTHADSGAIDFFKSCEFSDDFILNSKFRDLEEDWTNTTTMSYFPPYTTGAFPDPSELGHATGESHYTQSSRASFSLTDIKDLEKDMELWRTESIAAYQAQAIFMNRIFKEIKMLRNQVTSQQDQINTLTSNLEKAKDENCNLQEKLFQHQLSDLMLEKQQWELNPMDPEDCTATKTDRSEKTDHPMELQESVAAALSRDCLQNIKGFVSKLVAPILHQRLCYYGSNLNPDRLQEILHSGFSTADFHPGEYGRGLYFTACPAAARGPLPPYQVLVADVYIGRVDVVHDKQACRTHPADGYDSIMVPGRMSNVTFPHIQKELVIFSHLQAIPICILKYSKQNEMEDG